MGAHAQAHTAGGNQKKVAVCVGWVLGECVCVCVCTLHFNCFTFQSLFPFRPHEKKNMGEHESGCVCEFQKEKEYFKK